MYVHIFMLLRISTQKYWEYHLGISLEVVVEYMDTDSEVSCVEWVGPVPALRPKLPPLNHHSMEIHK